MYYHGAFPNEIQEGCVSNTPSKDDQGSYEN